MGNGVSYVVCEIARIELHSHDKIFIGDFFLDCCDNFEDDASAVLQGAAVLVRPLVYAGAQKLTCIKPK